MRRKNYAALAFSLTIISALQSYATLEQEDIDNAREYIRILNDSGETFDDIAGKLGIGKSTLTRFRQGDPELARTTRNSIMDRLRPDIERELRYTDDLLQMFNYSFNDNNESLELSNSLWRLVHRIDKPIHIPPNQIYGANPEGVITCLKMLMFEGIEPPWHGRQNISRWYRQLNESEKLSNFSRLIDFYKILLPEEQVFVTQIVAALDIEYLDPCELLQQMKNRPTIMQFKNNLPLHLDFQTLRDNIDIIEDPEGNRTRPNLTASSIAERVEHFLLGT